MANVYNLKGTSFPSFRIGKGGGSLSQGITSDILQIRADSTIDTLINNIVAISTDGTGLNFFTALDAGSGAGTHELRFSELTVNGVGYVGFRAPNVIATSTVWTLPDADGGPEASLTTDGAGTLSWTSHGASDLYEVYNSASQAIITANPPASVLFDTERFANPDFSVAAGVVTVTRSGIYSVEFSVSCDSTNNTRDSIMSEIYLNGVIYPASTAYSYHRMTNNGEATATKKVLMQLTGGNTVEVRTDNIAGNSCSTIATASNLLFERKGL